MTDQQMHVRELHVREVNDEARTFTGIAVPYDQQVPISDWFGDYNETFARGSVQDSDDALVYWRHSDPIGRLTANRDTDGGWEVTGSISRTPLGDEAYTLLRDGVVRSMSVGFQSIAHTVDDESGDITRTAVRVREVSLVPIPAYDGATITDVRHRQPQTPTPHQNRGDQPMTDVLTRADLDEHANNIRQQIEDIQRGIPDMLNQRDAAPATDTRSAGQIVLALARGDEDTVRAYEALQERAWGPEGQGGVLADDGSVRPQWVGDLTRLIEENSGLPALFSTGTLPDRGMKLEFGELNTNTTQVGTQANEGDNLVYGKVTTKSRSTDVITVGGYTGLSRQEIERSNANMVDLSLRGMAIAARKNKVAALRSAVAALRAKQIGRDTPNGRTTVTITDQTKYTGWVSGIIDAAGIYDDQGLSLENLLVDRETFKGLATMTDSTNRPLMTVYGEGVNAVGVVSAATLGGNIAGLMVRVDPRQADATPQFTNSLAIRVYNSPITSLTDSNIVNLTQLFSVYYYAAMADEIPGGLVPVVTEDPTAPAA